MRALLAALVAAFSLPACHGLAADKACEKAIEVISRVHGQVPDSTERRLRGADAKAFMDALNAEPPATAYTADEVMIFSAPSRHGVVYLVTFERGCKSREGSLPTGLLPKILGRDG
jgi:hypothetical protein